jgi:hypothetical protein
MHVKAATLLVGALSVLSVACGGSQESPAPSATATATAAAVELAPLLVAADGLPGFRPTGAEPVEQDDADAWAKTNEEADSSQLKALEFVAGARQDLIGPPGAYGLNLVERFRTDEEAGQRLTYTVRDLGNGKARFRVPGVPGAVGFESGSGKSLGRSVAFRKGATVFLLSHQVGKRTPSIARLKTAVRDWYAALPR